MHRQAGPCLAGGFNTKYPTIPYDTLRGLGRLWSGGAGLTLRCPRYDLRRQFKPVQIVSRQRRGLSRRSCEVGLAPPTLPDGSSPVHAGHLQAA